MAVVVHGYDYRDVGGRAMQGAIAEASDHSRVVRQQRHVPSKLCNLPCGAFYPMNEF